MKSVIILLALLSLVSIAPALDFFSTAYIETYRTDLGTTMTSPNLYFKLGRLEGYGFIDRYFMGSDFYHGEFLLAFQPFRTKVLDRLSIIAERRWDKFAPDENSYGFRIKIW